MNGEIADKLKDVPDEPGAYLMLDAQGEIIYVGKARSLRKRLQQWFRESSDLSPWAALMIERTRSFDFIVTRSELEALALEYNLIKEHEPRYNIKLVDDKSYPYLRLTDELYPRLTVVRDLARDARVRLPGRYKQQRGLHDPQQQQPLSMREGRLFGPYPSAQAMRRTMRVVQQLFGLRSCRRKLTGEPCGRPCLNYHIARCVGPCTGEVTPEEYGEIVREVCLFLEGRADEVLDKLRAQMEAAAEKLDFERAAQLRDRLKAVEKVTESQLMVATEERDQDALGVAMKEGRAVVALLAVRRGRLIEKQQFHLDQVEGYSEGEALAAFMAQHYQEAHIPREVLLSHAVEETDRWEEVLSELRGQKVRVNTPQRGEKRRLTELATHNAQLAADRAREQGAVEAEHHRALQELAEALGLEAPPERIECFDISNTQGREATGSMVVFTDGVADKAAYRRFRIWESGDRPDDYAMMNEVLMRRLRRAAEGDEKFLPLPELLVVDGGKGQLGVAERAVRSWELDDVTVASLAKREEEVFVPGRSDPVPMSAYPHAQRLMQQLRDEAHRFALAHHRATRDRRLTESVLEQVSGIGPARRRALLTTFGSLEAIAQATVEDLERVPGMTRSAAEALRRFLDEAVEQADTESENQRTPDE
ncbi:MAG: excinuclease ABC subunit UvrC [Armatimonadetes bacterium]|nr:excinuclease ABC subunit UvrC [Armatimonadota bacterium]